MRSQALRREKHAQQEDGKAEESPGSGAKVGTYAVEIVSKLADDFLAVL